jgi:predicted dehydrogenase
MPVRVGIIGSGHACAYAAAFARLQDATVTALAALPDDERRLEAAKKYTISSVYDSVETMLDKQHLDIVIVGSPPRYHRDHVCAALEAGAHVLAEKPPALNAQEAAACYFRALYCDRHLEYAFCYRHARGLPPPRPHLSSIHVRLRRTSGPTASWSRDPAQAGGGCLADIGVHAVDLALYALGDPVPVAVSGRMFNADGQAITSGCESTFTGVIEVSGGRRISLDISWTAEKDEQSLTCSGTSPAAPPHAGAVNDITPLVVDDDLYLRTAHGFLDHVFMANRAQQLEITARGIVVQRIVDAFYLSCARRHGVSLSGN